ncbi:MAG: PilZ domain-containing protein [Pseudomonadales bacterium]|nr:PilZ domain-containing protein [Pseudomonadales bacterium]
MTDSIHSRQHIRSRLPVSIKIMHPVLGEFMVTTEDISDGGAFFISEQLQQFKLNDVIAVQLLFNAEKEAPEVDMCVVRVEDRGVGAVYL